MFILHIEVVSKSVYERTVREAQGSSYPGPGTTDVFTCLALGTTQRILLKMKVKKARKLLMSKMLRKKKRKKKIMKSLD